MSLFFPYPPPLLLFSLFFTFPCEHCVWLVNRAYIFGPILFYPRTVYDNKSPIEKSIVCVWFLDV